jgi:hypothetical protein
MKRRFLVLVLFTLAAAIVTPVSFRVNSLSVNSTTVWADGAGSPVPPFPSVVDNTGSHVSTLLLAMDGAGSPVPPFPS